MSNIGHKSLVSHHSSVMLQYLEVFLIHDYFVSNQPGGGGVGSRVGSGQALRRSGQIIGSWSRVGSGRVQTLVGRVGSEKMDPGTTLQESPPKDPRCLNALF